MRGVDAMTLYERAEVRVRQMFASDTPEDRWAREFALTDWPEGDEHWAWLAGASASEVRDWNRRDTLGGGPARSTKRVGGTTRAGATLRQDRPGRAAGVSGA